MVGAAARCPPAVVLAAYGLSGPLTPLDGGQGNSWRVGPAVLKPLDMDPAVLPWQGDLLHRLAGRTDFRVSVPLTTFDGHWTAAGWTAWRYEPGVHLAERWHDIVDVGRMLHSALQDEPEPPFLSRRQDRWAIGDRLAWGRLRASDYPGVPHLAELTAAVRPLSARPQLIHGDLTGNVLFDDDLPPLVIDLSPYWRPPGFASAIVMADALLFEGAGEEVLEPLLLQDPTFPQYLLRAVIYRAVADHLARPNPLCHHDTDRYRSATRIALRLARSS